jgi:hypothetical protein
VRWRARSYDPRRSAIMKRILTYIRLGPLLGDGRRFIVRHSGRDKQDIDARCRPIRLRSCPFPSCHLWLGVRVFQRLFR